MINYIGKEVRVVIDRPLGSTHPEHGFYYPVNYGYLPGTLAGDGEEIDAYVLGEYAPLKEYTGKVIAVIHRKNDCEDKLVVAKSMDSFSKEQIKALIEFQERFFDSEIIILDYMKQSIRATVRGLIRRGDEVLLVEEYDEKDKSKYYHMPGGGIEFRENSPDALKREIMEELQANIVEYRMLCTLENIFTFDNINAHEISIVYEVQLGNEHYMRETFNVEGDVIPSKAVWVNKHHVLRDEVVIYPETIKNYL